MAAGWLAAAALLAAVGRPTAAFDVRVAKGFYTRPYNMVRLSVIGGSPAPGLPSEEAPSLGPAAYKSPFVHRWTTKTLQSELMMVADAGSSYDLGGGESIHLKLPAQGSGVTGLFFSDPCFTSRGGFECPNGDKFQVLDRLAFILNRLLGSDEFDFWGMLGDHFYDILGGVSGEFFARLSLKAKSKPFLAVVGNHDFWLSGQPPGGPGDQLGYGFMQFYGQDTVGGLGQTPYNFAGNPDALEIAHPENFIYGTQIGDLAFFGFSAAHDWPSTLPHAASFCEWAGGEQTVHAVVVLGHWDVCDLGCMPGMDTPSVFARMKAMSGCSSKRMLLFTGHQHCNRALNSSGPLNAYAFVVGGTGMYGPGCSQFGFTVLQSHPGAAGGPDARVDHFPIAASAFSGAGRGAPAMMRPAYWDAPPSYDRFEALASCLSRSGYAGCRAEHGQSLRALSARDIVVPRAIAAEAPTVSGRGVARVTIATTTTQTPPVISTTTLTTLTGTSTATTTFTAVTTTTVTTLTATTATSTTVTTLTATTTTTTSVSTRTATTTTTTSVSTRTATTTTALMAAVATAAASTTAKTPSATTASTAIAAWTRAARTIPAVNAAAATAATTTAATTTAAVTMPGSSFSFWNTFMTTTGFARRPATSTTAPPGPQTTMKEHRCWEGLHNPEVAWSWKKANWCCHELSLGCHKVVATTAGPTTASATTTVRRSTPAPLDHVLQRKPRADGAPAPDEIARLVSA